jgi:hypothetical protein
MKKNMGIAIRLVFLGIIICISDVSGQKVAEKYISNLHTLSIHIKDPAIHDSVFHFFIDRLKLPVYYYPLTLGERKYAGVFAGNLILEPCGPYSNFTYATDNFKAIFFGLTFEPSTTIARTSEILLTKQILHEVAGDEFIYLKDQGLCSENITISIMDKHEKVKDHLKLDSLRSVMKSSNSDLGIEYVKEIGIGFSSETNLQNWKKLISPSELTQSSNWKLNNMLEIQFSESKIKEVYEISFKVKSLKNARKYLSEQGLIGNDLKDEIILDPAKTFGLSIHLTEKN